MNLTRRRLIRGAAALAAYSSLPAWAGSFINPYHVSIPGTISGALVGIASDFTGDLSASPAFTWDTEIYDHGGWWSGGSPTIFTVPSGVAYIRLMASWANSGFIAGTNTTGIFNKNGSSNLGNIAAVVQETRTDGNEAATQQIVTPPLAVSAGDTFALTLGNTDTSTTIHKDGSWFSIEKLE